VGCGGRAIDRGCATIPWYPQFVAEPARKRATYDDVLNAPPHVVAEIVDGELRLSPRPAAPHSMAATALVSELGPPFSRGRGGPGGWLLLIEPEVHLGPDILVPDYGGWRRERMPFVTDVPYFTLPPDWVCEVLSPSTERTDRADKLPVYAREGVRHVWLVNPLQRTLEVLRLEGGRWLNLAVHRDDARVRAEPFDAIELELGVLWADVRLG
jgi:Uma2 family endonuclease